MIHGTCGTYLKKALLSCPYCDQVWCPHCGWWFTPPGSPRVLRDITLVGLVLDPYAVPFKDTPASTLASDREGTP